MRYSVYKGASFHRRDWYVYDHHSGLIVFRGTYEECHDWIDNPNRLALKQGEAVKKVLEEKK